MSDKQDLSYSGPNKNYEPQPGSNQPSFDAPRVLSGEYFNLDRLKDNLKYVIEGCALIVSMADKELNTFSLKLSDSDQLLSAAESVWVNFDKTKNSLLTYKQFLDLENNPDRSSKYLCSEFVKELRKPKGSSAIDIRSMAKILSHEVEKISILTDKYLSNITDSSEKRAIELFMDMAETSLVHVGRMQSFFSLPLGERNRKLPSEEIEVLSGLEARQYQALFTVQSNSANQEIDLGLDELKRNFYNTSDIFYFKFLGPTLDIRNKALKDIENKTSGVLMETVSADAGAAVNRSVAIGLYDALDRITKFNTLFGKLEQTISIRENYLSYVRQLEVVGVKADSKLTNGQDVDTSDTILRTNNSGLRNGHSNVLDRDNDNAHPQYLSKNSGNITGPIDLLDGVTVDGIVPSTHSHSGSDGSAKLSGRTIGVGELGSTSVSSNEYIINPDNLKVLSYKGTAGDFLSAKTFWNASKAYPFHELDVQFIQTIDFVDPALEGQPEKSNFIPETVPSGYVPPFEFISPLFIEWLTQIDYELF